MQNTEIIQQIKHIILNTEKSVLVLQLIYLTFALLKRLWKEYVESILLVTLRQTAKMDIITLIVSNSFCYRNKRMNWL